MGTIHSPKCGMQYEGMYTEGRVIMLRTSDFGVELHNL